jgi:hypothetical protein
MGQPGEGCALPGRFLPGGEGRWAGGRVAEAHHRRFSAGPGERGVPELRARGAVAHCGRRLGALYEAALGNDRLNPREAADGMAFIPPHQAQDLAAPGDGAPPGEWRGRVWLGRGAEGPLEVAEPAVVVVEQREGHLPALLDGRRRKAFGHAVPVRLVGELLAEVGSVLRAMRLLDRGHPLHSRAHPRHPAPQEVPRWRACQQDRRRPGGACRRGATPPSSARRWYRVWPCPRGWPSSRARGPGRKEDPRGRRGQPARSQVKRHSTQTTRSSR